MKKRKGIMSSIEDCAVKGLEEYIRQNNERLNIAVRSCSRTDKKNAGSENYKIKIRKIRKEK